MNKSLLHTPEGVRDVYGEEYARKLFVEKKLHDTIHLYGYQDIQTPTFEFFDVYSKEIGTTPSSQLYKFFDNKFGIFHHCNYNHKIAYMNRDHDI